MKTSMFTEEPIAFALRQAEGGVPIVELSRTLGGSEHTVFPSTNKSAGMGVAQVRRLRQLELENRTLKQLVADLSLDKAMRRDALKDKP